MRDLPAAGRLGLRLLADGGTLAFIARVPADGRYGTLDGVDAAYEDPRHVTTLTFQVNGLGWSRDRRNQLFVTDVPDVFGEPAVRPIGRAAQTLDADALRDHGVPAARQLTSADTDHHAPCFAADGSAVLVAAGRTGEPENLIDDLLRVPVDGAEPAHHRVAQCGLSGAGGRRGLVHRRRPGRVGLRVRGRPAGRVPIGRGGAGATHRRGTAGHR